jgi:hypothetical protein
MEPAIDVSRLPVPAQKMLDRASPAPLRQLGARGIAPGLKPADALTVVCLLAESDEPALADVARQTLEKIPAPLLNGALAGDLPPGVLDAIAPRYASDAAVMEKILQHAGIDPRTVIKLAAIGSEATSELIATNEERLLKHPEIIEKLYLNKATRMSTTDRLIELAVRSGLDLKGIPAFREAATAIANELIAEPSPEPAPGDVAFAASLALAEAVDPNVEVHELDDQGHEVVRAQHREKAKRIADMSVSEKVRLATLGSATERAILVRDSNRLVATAAVKSPALGEQEAMRIVQSRAVADEVLRIVATERDFVRNYMIKFYLIENPRTPFAIASKLIQHMRDHELKTLARSKNVTGAVATAAKQHLSRREKKA